MFSPYYAWSGKREPLNHVAVNVALYGKPSRWAMTERTRRDAEQTQTGFRVRTSAIEQLGDGRIKIVIDERGAPIPRKVRGEIILSPSAIARTAYPIDRAGEHLWRPIAPSAGVSVRMSAPDLSWEGTGYVDMNWGMKPLERTFDHWDWMRVDLGEGRSAVFYDTEELSGGGRQLALLCAPDGTAEPMPAPRRHRLPGTLWRVPRSGWSDGEGPTVRRTLEDTPFYVRTELDVDILGARRTAIQETLSLSRFRNTIVQLMLPFRMPRSL
ncbi:hypothetical protein RDV64_19080 [Acuticoccus sp. MNP-M23]|uniref:hypothetical protein n=1 Tax=Acuticoccus sp. MNP-M23 TaxID=3072793 RepID=UPI002815BC93|nr:hypothetical protein [Acuticoccus sp. MNP-M23]WMS42150.1 hypothetical protein RDV64_19080 [Acuticoccus sp. MNP-M23]